MRKIQLLLLGVSLISPLGVLANDYPTTLRVEYVLQCMAANGNKLEMLYKCSCSIDEIAQQVSVDTYIEGNTVLQLMGIGGEKGGLFRDPEEGRKEAALLRKAQAQANKKCLLR
jgi:hypothetical protein